MVGLRVTGNSAPEYVNPEPVRLALLTVTGEVPDEVRFTDWVMGVPTGSSPKLRLVVLNVSTGSAGFVPVPLRLTVLVLPPEELLEIVMLPLAAPAVAGSKFT